MVKKILISVYLILFSGLMILNILGSVRGYGIFISPLTYWMVLIGWLFFVCEKKLKSNQSFKVGFVLFVISSFLVICGLRFIPEVVMKISFIGWLMGIVQASIEYKLRDGRD